MFIDISATDKIIFKIKNIKSASLSLTVSAHEWISNSNVILNVYMIVFIE